MDTSIILGLIQNTAILLAFSMIYDYSWVQGERSNNILKKIVIGIIIGGIGLSLMLTPWKQFPGLIFDTKSVLLSLSGLFFGFVPTFISAAMMLIYRTLVGGSGELMGIVVIISSSAIGLLWKKFRPAWKENNYLVNLLALGFLVHLVMLCCTFLLPREMIADTLRNITLPLLTIYPGGTLLLGILMVRQYRILQL
jgi:hypothetical protein